MQDFTAGVRAEPRTEGAVRMRRRQKSPLWPYLCVLGCLFVLSITAPRAWQRMAREQDESRSLALRRDANRAIRSDTVHYYYDESYEPADTSELQSREAALDAVPLAETAASEPSPQPAPNAAEEREEKQAPSVPEAPECGQSVVETESPGDAAEATTELTAESDGEPAEATSDQPPQAVWPLPRVLIEQLQQLAGAEPAAAWASEAIKLVQEICEQGSATAHPTADNLRHLRLLAEGDVAAISDPVLNARLTRARYALVRWLDVWESAMALAENMASQPSEQPRPEALAAKLAQVEAILRRHPNGASWRKYLNLDSLRALATSARETASGEGAAAAGRALARHVLNRLSPHRLTRSQLKFVQREPVAALEAELRAWAAEPVTATALLEHLEAYEESGRVSDARRVADDWYGLSCCDAQAPEAVGHSVDTHYRNANLRFAASAALLNRLVPQPKPVTSTVSDTVVNVPVYGSSTTFTTLSVRLVPDPRRVRVGLEALGRVSSDTYSSSGPATFRNAAQSTFLVRKLLVLGPQGLSVWPAVSAAENNYTYLVSLDTNFDGVPLFGSLVRNIALNQHEELRDEARLEAQQKVAVRAALQFDSEVRPRLIKAAEKVQAKQVATLERLGMELVPVSLSTTEERAVGRYRLGTAEQLGAHTPRPRAPSDCWFSLQIHESALNNGLDRLDLNGREFALPELFAWISKKLDRPGLAKLEDIPDDVHVKFAQQDSVHVKLQGDRAELTISLAKLTQGEKSWRNFTVRASYRPEAHGLAPLFVRDERAISFEGRGVQGKLQPVLRAIFGKVLSRNRDIRLLNDEITGDSRVQDLAISQFTLDDGWIGLAYSPKRPPNVARREK